MVYYYGIARVPCDFFSFSRGRAGDRKFFENNFFLVGNFHGKSAGADVLGAKKTRRTMVSFAGYHVSLCVRVHCVWRDGHVHTLSAFVCVLCVICDENPPKTCVIPCTCVNNGTREDNRPSVRQKTISLLLYHPPKNQKDNTITTP